MALKYSQTSKNMVWIRNLVTKEWKGEGFFMEYHLECLNSNYVVILGKSLCLLDRILTGLLTQQIVPSPWWYFMKTSLTQLCVV